MTGRRLVLAALAVSVLAALGVALPAALEAGPAAAVPTTSVSVSLGSTRQVIQGFGTSERVWIDPHLSGSSDTEVPLAAQEQILTSLYGRLGLTRVRDVLDAGVQPSPGAKFDFTGKRGDAHVAYVKQAQRFGLRTFFPGPRGLEGWMTADDPGAYVDWAMAMLLHWKALGREPALYAPLNEPEIAQNFPPAWMHEVVLQLGRRMRAAGLQTKLVIPDDQNPVAALRRGEAVLRDPQARQYVAALAYHIYGGTPRDWPALRSLASKYGLPVWMTEYWSADYGKWPGALGWATDVHYLLTLGEVNAVDYIWAFFGDWVGPGGTLLGIRFDNGVYRSFEPNPVYWITGQWSRFVRPGDVRVATTTKGGPALVSAFKGRGRLTLVAINPMLQPAALRVQAKGGALGSRAAAVRTSASEQWRTLPTLPVRRASFVATLPAQSVTTFVVPLKG
jgi:O-glycosyl hydrolase